MSTDEENAVQTNREPIGSSRLPILFLIGFFMAIAGMLLLIIATILYGTSACSSSLDPRHCVVSGFVQKNAYRNGRSKRPSLFLARLFFFSIESIQEYQDQCDERCSH
jgi:hypothetical protein